jgi:hypothetical protein
MSYLRKATKSQHRKILALSKDQSKNILLFIIIAVSLATFIIMLIVKGFTLDGFTSALTWAGIAALASSAGALGFWNFAIKTKRIKTSEFLFPWWLILTLIGGAVALPFIGIYFGFLTIVPPTPPSPPGPVVNATIEVQPLGINSDVTGFCEVKLWQTYNESNITTWSEVSLSGNSPGVDFYKDGWLNAVFFSQTLSGKDSENRSVAYWVQTRVWHKLSEWTKGTYTPPGWWTPWVNLTSYLLDIKQVLEENETGVTWDRISTGKNIIYLFSEPYTLTGKIEDPITFDRWNSTNGAYANNYTNNWKVFINIPANETSRGFNQEYDWLSQQYYGGWLIASSDSWENINRTYTDEFGSTFPLWFNVTIGRNIMGAVLNDSIIATSPYDIAFLLPTFNWNWQFQANIQICNGSNGIHWYLGRGYENNIQIIRAL